MGGGTGGGAVGSITLPAVLSTGKPGFSGIKFGGIFVLDAIYGSGNAIGVARDGLTILLALVNADA